MTTKSISHKRPAVMDMNIFSNFSTLGYGHSNVDEIAYFTSFPRGPRPHDVKLTSADSDSFPFIIVTGRGFTHIHLGRHSDTHQLLIAYNRVIDNDTIIKGRVWKDSRYIVINQPAMTFEELIELDTMLMQSLHISIGTWKVVNNRQEAVVPDEQYLKKSSKIVKHTEKLITLLDKKLKDKKSFTFDLEHTAHDISSTLRDYVFFYSHGKIDHDQTEFQRVTSTLRDYYLLIKDYQKEQAKKINITEIRSFYRKKIEKCRHESEDVMKRYFNLPTNGLKPIIVDNATIESIIRKHGDKGVIFVPAFLEDVDPDTSDENTRMLLADIKRNDYRFFPVYHRYQTSGHEQDTYQPSFLVFNKPIGEKSESRDFSELLELSKQWSTQSHQECHIVKSPDATPVSFDKDIYQYANPIPQTIPERMIRKAKGEIMLY